MRSSPAAGVLGDVAHRETVRVSQGHRSTWGHLDRLPPGSRRVQRHPSEVAGLGYGAMMNSHRSRRYVRSIVIFERVRFRVGPDRPVLIRPLLSRGGRLRDRLQRLLASSTPPYFPRSFVRMSTSRWCGIVG